MFFLYLSEICTPKIMGLSLASNSVTWSILSFLNPFVMEVNKSAGLLFYAVANGLFVIYLIFNMRETKYYSRIQLSKLYFPDDLKH